METAFGDANLKHFDILQIMTQCEPHLEIWDINLTNRNSTK
jgi:hypothetical protein